MSGDTAWFWASLLQWMTLVKMGVAVLMVVGLSLLAEYVSPRFAGIVSGYPLGGALSLIFIGIEAGPRFAAQSAVYSTAGVGGTLTFVYGYLLATHLVGGKSRMTAILFCTGGAALFYIPMATLLKSLRLDLVFGPLVAIALILFYEMLMHSVPDAVITEKKRLNAKLLMARAFFAALIIVLITSSAKLVGPRWAGIFAAFPTTMYPLIVIVHYSYRAEHVRSVIKNTPRGVVSLLIFCLAVGWFYPSQGVLSGTLIAYLLATVYLVLINLPWKKWMAGPIDS